MRKRSVPRRLETLTLRSGSHDPRRFNHGGAVGFGNPDSSSDGRSLLNRSLEKFPHGHRTFQGGIAPIFPQGIRLLRPLVFPDTIVIPCTRSTLGLIPLGRGTGGGFDFGNQAAVQFAHQRAQVLDDLLPTIRVTDGVLRAGDAVRGHRKRE